MHFKTAALKAAAALLAFNLAASAVQAQEDFDAARYISPEYLSEMTGMPVFVFGEDDIGPAGTFDKLIDLKTRRGRSQDEAEKEALSEQELAILNSVLPPIEEAFRKDSPEFAERWMTDADPGLLRFLVDSASVRDVNVSGACQDNFGCAIFIGDDMPSAQDWDRRSGVTGANTLSVPDRFWVLRVWEEMDNGLYKKMVIDGREAWYPIPQSQFKMIERALREGIVTSEQMDSYFQLGMVKNVVRHGESIDFSLLCYYLYLKGERDAEKVVDTMPEISKQAQEVHTLIQTTLFNAPQTAEGLEQARQELKQALVDIAQDASQPEIARFYAGAFLQMYDKRGDARPANAPADFPFYNNTLEGALTALSVENSPAPAPVVEPK